MYGNGTMEVLEMGHPMAGGEGLPCHKMTKSHRTSMGQLMCSLSPVLPRASAPWPARLCPASPLHLLQSPLVLLHLLLPSQPRAPPAHLVPAGLHWTPTCSAPFPDRSHQPALASVCSTTGPLVLRKAALTPPCFWQPPDIQTALVLLALKSGETETSASGSPLKAGMMTHISCSFPHTPPRTPGTSCAGLGRGGNHR